MICETTKCTQFSFSSLHPSLTPGSKIVYIYIYTRKPGRSPTRQYGVLRPFLTCAASLDFFWCFKKICLLATQNQANPGHQGEKRWKGLDMCKVCTEAVHSVALCPEKNAQTPKPGNGKEDRNRARGVFQGRRTSRSAGIYIYIEVTGR